MPKTPSIQGSLFEEDYLIKSLGSIASSPDVALTELVANAWDAGARRVEITIPEGYDDGEVVVSDDGCGMTPAEFRERWMRLGYDRVARQGVEAERVPGIPSDSRVRRAFGRNGMGRHGMLCFANTYLVKSCKQGQGVIYRVSTAAGKDPFRAELITKHRTTDRGTVVSARPNRRLPSPERIRRVLSARFLHDPEFTLLVNGASLPLTEHEGLVRRETALVQDVTFEIFVVDAERHARTVQQHGVAFWVGNRLVGEPSWIVGGHVIADGRTTVARRHTIVVRTSQLYEEVLPDWTGFRATDRMHAVFEGLAKKLTAILRSLAVEKRQETAEVVLREHRHQLGELHHLARYEVAEFVDAVTKAQPNVQTEALSAAVQAVINLERSRSGQALLQKLSTLSEGDIAGLNALLDSWSVRDALTVLDEIDRRLAVVEALARFSGDKTADELTTLHPLVTQARWLFGPEFDSPLYSSNLTIRKAVEKVFGERKATTAFVNHRNRPDLMVLSDGATLSAVATEEIGSNGALVELRRVLIVELKRGGYRIKREEVHQASDYVEDLLHCGLLDGSPFVHAFVIGDEVDDKVETIRVIGKEPERGRIEVATYSQLVRTASQRLFKLRGDLAGRYDASDNLEILNKAMRPDDQRELAVRGVKLA